MCIVGDLQAKRCALCEKIFEDQVHVHNSKKIQEFVHNGGIPLHTQEIENAF